MLKVSDMAQVIKKCICLSEQNQMIYFTLFTFQIYSSSLRFQQKEPKNHSNGMSDHKNVEGDQT